jgi:hypothetical protein
MTRKEQRRQGAERPRATASVRGATSRPVVQQPRRQDAEDTGRECVDEQVGDVESARIGAVLKLVHQPGDHPRDGLIDTQQRG